MSYTYEYCAAVAAKYTTKRDFRTNANKELQWLRRNKLFDQACAHMQPLRRSFTDKEIAEIALRYANRRAFKLGDQGAYIAAAKREILNHVCAHMSGERYRILSDEQIAEIASQFHSRVEFLKSDNGAYQTATKRGILDEVCAHMDYRETRRLSDEEILSIAKTFKTRNDLKLGDFGVYTTAIRRGLIEAACEHMEYGFCGFREDKPAVLYQFRLDLPGGVTLYKVGITNRKPRQRLNTMGIRHDVSAELINFRRFDLGRDARITEKRLHRKFKSYRYDGDPIMSNGNTEIFTIPLIAG